MSLNKPRPRTLLVALAALVTFLVGGSWAPVGAQRQVRGGTHTNVSGSRSASGASANRSATATRNTNTNVNRNTNVNVHRDVDIDVDDDWDGFDDDWDDDDHPVARGVAVGTAVAATAAAIGSIVNQPPPGCVTQVVNGIAYEQCGGTWYQPQYQGDSVTYVVVNPP